LKLTSSPEKFETISPEDLPRLNKALLQERNSGTGSQESHFAFFDITPYPYQQEILDRLAAERALHRRNKTPFLSMPVYQG